MIEDFWANANPENDAVANGGVSPSWMTWDSEYVEVERGLKTYQVFLFYSLSRLAYNQINNRAYLQFFSRCRSCGCS